MLVRRDDHNLSDAIYKNKGQYTLVLLSEPEKRNPRTGLPEAAFYRPPDPKNIRAAKNALGVLFVGFLFAIPFWLMLTEEWSHILRNIEKVVGK